MCETATQGNDNNLPQLAQARMPVESGVPSPEGALQPRFGFPLRLP